MVKQEGQLHPRFKRQVKPLLSIRGGGGGGGGSGGSLSA